MLIGADFTAHSVSPPVQLHCEYTKYLRGSCQPPARRHEAGKRTLLSQFARQSAGPPDKRRSADLQIGDGAKKAKKRADGLGGGEEGGTEGGKMEVDDAGGSQSE